MSEHDTDPVKLRLTAKAVELTGWEAIRVSRSLDRVPSEFDIALSDRSPVNPNELAVEPGMECQVLIGNDLVITGYVDQVMLGYTPQSHRLRVTGRSRLADLVDCSITPDILNGGQIQAHTLSQLAQKLVARFPDVGVKVLGNPSLSFGQINQINAGLTETGWDLLERAARSIGVLLYDDEAGNLVIADAAVGAMASGFKEGNGVEAAQVTYAMQERFSVYLPYLLNMNFLGNQGQGGVAFTPAQDQGPAVGTLNGSVRYRPKVIVSEQFIAGKSLAEERAQWEAARRWGRSQTVQLTVDSWRDAEKALWTPNYLAPIYLPTLKLTPNVPWVIGSVAYSRDAMRGTVSEVSLMPKQAFQPEPNILLPWLYDPTLTQGHAIGGGPGPTG